MSETLFTRPTIPVEYRRVTTDDGQKLSVAEYGPADADVIVFAHGWSMNATYWWPQVHALAGEYRVVTYDQRGHGHSTIGSSASQEILGRDVRSILKSVVPEGKKAIIVGHSMGGMSILSYAAQFPDEVSGHLRSAVLCCSAARSAVPTVSRPALNAKSITREVRIAVSRAVMANTWYFPTGDYGEKLFRGSYGRVSDQEAVDFGNRINEQCPVRTRGMWGRVLRDVDVTAGLERLAVPVRVIAGEQDLLLPRRLSDYMVEKLDAAGNLDRYDVLPGCGHMAPHERPEQFHHLLSELATTR